LVTDRATVIGQAIELVGLGQFSEAKPILERVIADPALRGSEVAQVNTLKALARCYRAEGDFESARRAARDGLKVAESIENAGAQATMLEALGMIESADGHTQLAAQYLFRSAEVERARNDLEGEAAALSNYALMLTNLGIEGAEPLLRRGIEHTPEGSMYRSVIADNLGSELGRQGRPAEAASWARLAADGFAAQNKPFDRFTALVNLSRHLAAAGDGEEAGAAFTEAHDLIHSLRSAQINDARYADYNARVAAIEHQIHSGPETVEQGFMMALDEHGMQMFERDGQLAIEEGRYGDALEALGRARELCMKLEALHRIASIECHIGYALIELGERRSALDRIFTARRVAHDLGDAWHESMALSLLARLPDLHPEYPLDLLAQMQALAPAVGRQLGATDDQEVLGFNSGVTDAEAATMCGDAHAYALATRYMEAALEAGRALPEVTRYRLGYRLHNAYLLYRRIGDTDRAIAVLNELRQLADELDDSRLKLAAARVFGFEAFREGDRSPATLDLLLEACAAYEQLRRIAGPAGEDLESLGQAVDGPYDEAAELALLLAQSSLGLSLIERGKARSLLEQLAPDAVGSFGEPPRLPETAAIGDAVGIEMLLTESHIHLLFLDGITREVTATSVEHDANAPESLARALDRLSDAADSERSLSAAPDVLENVLTHPTFRLLADHLLAATAGRSVWLAPHRHLHIAPWQLASRPLSPERVPAADELSDRPVPWSLIPSLSLVAVVPAPVRRRPGAVVAVMGDPLGDLPFARAEAALVGAGDNAALTAIGSRCTAEWLRECCADHDVGVLHIACHGRFDRNHPQRSGLVLADSELVELPGTLPARLMTIDEIAELRLAGAVVVLSACSSGLSAIVEGDEAAGLISGFLRAGAAAVIASHWPIDDLSAMFLMSEVHAGLRAAAGPADLGELISAAGTRLRRLTARELCGYGLATAQELISRGHPSAEALAVAAQCLRRALTTVGDEASLDVLRAVDPVTIEALQALRPPDDERGAATPFADPAHWGAFTVVGHLVV
jgi:tetratricopeptide (TPR) repeat protein